MTEKPRSKKGWWLKVTFVMGIVLLISFIFAVCEFNTVNSPSIRSQTLVLMMALDGAAQAYLTDNGAWPKTINNSLLYSILSGADSGKVYLAFKTRNISPQGEIFGRMGNSS